MGGVLEALVEGLIEEELAGALVVDAALEGLGEVGATTDLSGALHTN